MVARHGAVAKKYSVSFRGGDKNVLRLTVSFKWVNSIICESHLTKAVKIVP